MQKMMAVVLLMQTYSMVMGGTPGASAPTGCSFDATCCGGCTGFMGKCRQDRQIGESCDVAGRGDCGPGLICVGDSWDLFRYCKGTCKSATAPAPKPYQLSNANVSCEWGKQGQYFGVVNNIEECYQKCNNSSTCTKFMWAPGASGPNTYSWGCRECHEVNVFYHAWWNVYEVKSGGRRLTVEEERLAHLLDDQEDDQLLIAEDN